jgi:very-short-patch-repair endonuclease
MREPDARTLGAPVVPHDEASLLRVAAEQGGLLTRPQCLAAGLTDPAIRWRLSRGRWIGVHHGVYLTVLGRDDWRTGALAAQLAVDGSAWSHRTAAFVDGLIAVPPQHIDLVIEARHRIRTPRGVLLHRRVNADAAVDPLHWPWRTTVEETLLDVSANGTADEMFAILGRAFQRRLTTEQAVLARLAVRTRHPRRELLQLVLADAADGAESAMEVRFVRDVLRPHGLPLGVRQRSTSPDRRERHDVGFPEQRVLVELDGRLGHEGREARVKDGRRDRRSAAGGWLTVRAFWVDVAVTPCELAVEVAAILGSRGWRDTSRSCRRRECSFRRASLNGAKSAL